jgi:hypothetical protein
MVSCTKCGAEIKYIPVREGHIVVDVKQIEVINERGRVVQGYLRHKCKEADNERN